VRPWLHLIAQAVFAVSFIYGEYGAIRLFFDVQTCYTVIPKVSAECYWLLESWSLPAKVIAFSFYLPFSTLVTVYFAFPGYIFAALLEWIAQKGEAGSAPTPASHRETEAAPVAEPTIPEPAAEPAPQPAPQPALRRRVPEQTSAEAGEVSIEPVVERWAQVLDRLGQTNKNVQTLLRDARPLRIEDGAVVIGCRFPFYRDRLNEDRSRLVVESVLGQVLGRQVRLRFAVDSPDTPREVEARLPNPDHG
jgi:hypothetical protein